MCPIQRHFKILLPPIAMQYTSKVSQVHRSKFVSEVKDQTSISRLGGLLEQQQCMKQATLPGAVCSEQARDRPQRHVSGVRPGLEVLEPDPGQHQSFPFKQLWIRFLQPCFLQANVPSVPEPRPLQARARQTGEISTLPHIDPPKMRRPLAHPVLPLVQQRRRPFLRDQLGDLPRQRVPVRAYAATSSPYAASQTARLIVGSSYVQLHGLVGRAV